MTVQERRKTIAQTLADNLQAPIPQTLGSCIKELEFWGQFRADYPEAKAREFFVLGLLSEVRPRSVEEVRRALRYLIKRDIKCSHTLENLLKLDW